jgi:mono/diheme cytochrome c family protein
MVVWVVLAVWVVIGLGVFLVAMRGTRRKRADDGDSRFNRRVTGVGFTIVVLAFAIAIPAIAMVDNSGADSVAKGGVDLTAEQVHGRELFAHNCATCHTLAAVNAVGKVGPNLDQLRPAPALVLPAIQNGRARGHGQLPAGLLSGPDAKAVASFVGAVAGR